MKRLRQYFYSMFDEGLVRALADRHQVPGEFLGEGFHFEAFKVCIRPGDYIVLKRSTERFGLHLSPGERKSWIARVNQLAQEDIPLIPPQKAWESLDRICVAMPFGLGPITDKHEPPITEMKSRLARKGLKIEDQIQIKWWHDIPFVCDLSDLRDHKPRR